MDKQIILNDKDKKRIIKAVQDTDIEYQLNRYATKRLVNVKDTYIGYYHDVNGKWSMGLFKKSNKIERSKNNDVLPFQVQYYEDLMSDNTIALKLVDGVDNVVNYKPVNNKYRCMNNWSGVKGSLNYKDQRIFLLPNYSAVIDDAIGLVKLDSIVDIDDEIKLSQAVNILNKFNDYFKSIFNPTVLNSIDDSLVNALNYYYMRDNSSELKIVDSETITAIEKGLNK